jgi:DNA helicase-2/ATP-dependent DNA helicase PcrA
LEEERRLAFVGLTRAKDELHLSYAVNRDFRGVRRRTIPSSFLMEMPREELELVDEATAYIAKHEQEREHGWLEGDSDEEWIAQGLEPHDEWPTANSADLPVSVVRSAVITTAAAMERGIAEPERLGERVSPDVFQQGMTVSHPEYGPGKIVALSGAGKNRRATVQFPSVGEKKIILAHSALRPAR